MLVEIAAAEQHRLAMTYKKRRLLRRNTPPRNDIQEEEIASSASPALAAQAVSPRRARGPNGVQVSASSHVYLRSAGNDIQLATLNPEIHRAGGRRALT